jgi:hypothetical protein
MVGQVMCLGAAKPRLLVRPAETSPCEGCRAEAHGERADGGQWEHLYLCLWLGLIVLGVLMMAASFVVRIDGL